MDDVKFNSTNIRFYGSQNTHQIYAIRGHRKLFVSMVIDAMLCSVQCAD